MKPFHRLRAGLVAFTLAQLPALHTNAAETPIKTPRFSIENMDKSVDPGADFYRYAAGGWIKNNPVPSDKSRWSGFDELQDRNWQLIRGLLETSAQESTASPGSPRRQVGDFFASAMDTNRIEALGFKAIAADLKRIDDLQDITGLFRLVGEWHERGASCFFSVGVSPNAKNSEYYALQAHQGGLSLPDRDYYLKEDFAKQRSDYLEHVTRMLKLLGETAEQAAAEAKKILEIETAFATASRTRVELRDPNKNYNRFTLAEFAQKNPTSAWPVYFETIGVAKAPEVIVGQPEFFTELDKTLKARPMEDWRTYLRWHTVRSASPYLHSAAESESFAFYGTKLRGQPAQEPRWQRSAKVIDGAIGEALGKLYVEKYFPEAARTRMAELVQNLREVFRERLKNLAWMSEATRGKALAKFDRFTQKIGHPPTFRDYANIEIKRDDYWGNIQRSNVAESRRDAARVGKKVDTAEWHMTPQTVNAYFNPLQNEIVFPAGILQPPFFDLEADDAINYGAIGVVIGHEITHGYDDKGRQYDADGNLNDWWTDADAKEFDARAQKVVAQYGAYEALPGQKVNGQLTLGENIADLGGASIAYEALQRALKKDPAKRRSIDGFTPEQRFFLSLAQLWRTNWREAELRRRLVVDVHSPGQFRAIGPHVNMTEFFDAFGIKSGSLMWREPAARAKIW